MPGILVHGSNHFIVEGPEPADEEARTLVRRWSIITIGSGIDATKEAGPWRAKTRELRENLTWAVVVGDDRDQSDAVRVLLGEMTSRGVPVRRVMI